jgi:Family of unknown function (DUF6491)
MAYRKIRQWISCAVLCASTSLAAAETPPAADAPASEASIPFANHGGIYSWQVVDDRTVLIESRGRKWYKAILFSPCIGLSFSETLGFESNPSGSFDKFSSIKFRHQNCPLATLVETAAPAKKAKPKSGAAAPAAIAAPATPPN